MLDLDRSAAAFGARVAVRTPLVALTYADLAARVTALERALAASGVQALDRVVLRCRPTVATIETALALLARRCVILPVAGDAPVEGLRATLEIFAPAWEACEGEVAPGALPDVAAPGFPDGEACQALLSSGSVGRPKIVLRSRAQVEAGVRIFVAAMGLGTADRVLLLVPLEHSVGFNSLMLGALSVGAQIVLPVSRHPRGIVDEIEAHEATFFPAPPLFFEWMVRFAEARPRRLGNVRVCLSVGDALPSQTYDGFVDTFGTALWQSYGASEAGPLLLNRDGTHGDGVMALGQPYPEVEVDVRDDSGASLPDGSVGEIVARSPAVALGYVGEHDAGSRLEGGEFFTGDLGLRQGGAMHFSGRRKVMITRAGRKIDPAEVERVLCRHPEVIDAAVRSAGSTGDDPLEALVVLRSPVAVEALIEHCQGYLESHKIPRLVQIRRELPRDATGKLKREQLRAW